MTTPLITLPREPFRLAKSSHGSTFTGEACWSELGSILAGEPFSDRFRSCSPIVRRMGIALNDRLGDDPRQLLRPFALRALGTASDGREDDRSRMCSEWLLHHALPDMLDAAGRADAATKLRELPADLAVEGVRRAIYEARDEARIARTEARNRLRDRILEEMKERALVAADVAAAVAAAVDADAAVAADVAAAVAAAVAVAVAVAVDAAVAAAVAAAAAAAVDADAAADVAAAVAADADPYGRTYTAVYHAVYARMRERAEQATRGLLPSALDLMDRMLPAVPLQPPVIDYADVVCALPTGVAA